MRRLIACLCLFLLPVSVQAQDRPPRYYKVVGVASGDVLNIRAAPDGSAEVLGGLEPGAHPVEIGATDGTGNWGRIAFMEYEGWVSMKFLQEITVPMLPDSTRDGRDTGLPVGLACFGTEPFWGVRLDSAKSATYSSFEYEDTPMQIGFIAGASGRLGLPAALEARAENGLSMTATIGTATCSDGMSDSTFPMSITAILEGDQLGSRVYEGCCTLRTTQ